MLAALRNRLALPYATEQLCLAILTFSALRKATPQPCARHERLVAQGKGGQLRKAASYSYTGCPDGTFLLMNRLYLFAYLTACERILFAKSPKWQYWQFGKMAKWQNGNFIDCIKNITFAD